MVCSTYLLRLSNSVCKHKVSSLIRNRNLTTLLIASTFSVLLGGCGSDSDNRKQPWNVVANCHSDITSAASGLTNPYHNGYRLKTGYEGSGDIYLDTTV